MCGLTDQHPADIAHEGKKSEMNTPKREAQPNMEGNSLYGI